MALYRVATEKRGQAAPYLNQQWRNIYTIEADSYASALAVGDVIMGHEMEFHSTEITGTRVTAHLVTEPPRRVGAQMSSTRPGVYEAVGDAWPLWNVVMATFTDVGLGRPERKFYRVGLHDGMVTDDFQLAGTYQSPTLSDGLNGIFLLTNYVGPSGEQHADVSFDQTIHNRQLGWHRRRRLGFVRGYVPV